MRVTVASEGKLAAIPVQEWMSRRVVAALPDESVRTALELMLEHGTRHVLVLQGEELRGIVSNRDVIRTTGRNPERRLDLACAVGEIMTPAPLAVTHPEASLGSAARAMHERGVSVLPVLCHGRVVGVLTSQDILRAIPDRPARGEGLEL